MRNGTVMELEKAAANGVEYHPQAKAAKDLIGAALKLRVGLRRKEDELSFPYPALTLQRASAPRAALG